MVLVTGWIILRWLHKILRREKRQEEISLKEKMLARLDIVMTDEYRPVKIYCQYFQYKDDSGCDLSLLHQELLSLQAVLEIKTEEGRRLRKEREEGWREDKGAMTEETFSDRMVIYRIYFHDFHDNCFSVNKGLNKVSLKMK